MERFNLDQRFTEKHFREAPKQFHLLMFKEHKICSMNVNLNLNVAPPSIEFKGALSLKDSHSNSKEEVDIAKVFHCNGLLLCTTKDYKLVVWNPLLGETRWILPKTRYHYTRSRFALGYQNNKSCRSYKILTCWDCQRVYKPDNRFEIYDFSSDSWRFLDEIVLDDCLILPNAVSLKGNTFWTAIDLTDYDSFILSFDFTTERFKRFCLPPVLYMSPDALSVVKEERISVLHHCLAFKKVEIWVTNIIDTEAALSWSKSFTVDFPNIPCNLDSSLVSFFIDQEKKVVLCCNESLKISKKMVYTIGEDDGYYTETPYANTTNKSSLHKHHKWVPFIFSYVPTLVHIQQDGDKRKSRNFLRFCFRRLCR